jgi:hypothetical protein
MKNRLLSFALLAIVMVLLFGVDRSFAQGSRRAEPKTLSSGYYGMDTDDDAPLPWRPNPFFMDTTYHPFEWHRVRNGAQQFVPPNEQNYYFRNPNQQATPGTMDTTDNCIAGPIPIGFTFYFYNQPYDSLIVSSNGYIGFLNGSSAYGAWSGTTSPYSAATYPDLKTNMASEPRAIIAALKGDLDMIPAGDTTKVYVRTSPFLDSFFVNFYNFRLRPTTTNNTWPRQSTGWTAIFIRKMQIVLTRVDSSIQINYGPFSGLISGIPAIQAWRVFQMNCGIGTINHTSPPTEYTSFLAGNKVYSPPGRWDANLNTNCKTCNKNLPQSGSYSIKFKQWKNIVRTLTVDFPPRNYEICLGNTVNPTATFTNVDAIPQTFKVKFQIRNYVTGVAVYGRTFTLANMLPAEVRSTKAGDFAPYATNPNILNQLGTFRACAVATSFDQNDGYIGDRWPFDDTACIRIFGIRTTTVPFNDPTDVYNSTPYFRLPDQTHWVSIGATVEDGQIATYDPPAPRYTTGNGVGVEQLLDPVIHLDAFDQAGLLYAGSNVGDTLVSFPYNLAGVTKGILTFDYQRTGLFTYPLGWDGSTLLGPEKTVLTPTGLARKGDSLTIEFKLPTEPPCNPSSGGWTRIASIDGGGGASDIGFEKAADFEFHHFSVRLDQFTKPNFSYFNSNFRFRLRLMSNWQGTTIPPVDDDGDDFYIDNVTLQVPKKPEVEIMWVRIIEPYTSIPSSQTVSLPVYVHIANNSSDVAIAFPIRVQILDPNDNTVYWAIQTVTQLPSGHDTTVIMPNWNALYAGQGGTFRAHAFLASSGYDSYVLDNGVWGDFFLPAPIPGTPQEFAYDDGSNDIPVLTLVPSNGTSALAPALGQGSVPSGIISGSLAMKFTIITKDTVYGIRAFFAAGNQANDPIRLTILKGKPGSCVPTSDTVFKAQMVDVRQGDLFDKYWAYYFPEPIILNPGVYWASVGQMATDAFYMGADISRGGGRLRVVDPQVPVILPMYGDQYGTSIGANVNTGDISCAFAKELVAGSGNWSTFMPGSGAWMYTNIGNPYNSNGIYYPMIRVMVSKSEILPVEFVYLHGKNDNGKSLLTWATAQEKNNAGFFVERRRADLTEGFFEKVGYVAGKGTSNVETGYSFVDRNVTPGSYTYRLVQTDLDGSEHTSNTVNVDITNPTEFSLEQNFPNPFGSSTEFTYTLPTNAPTSIVVYNALGQVVRTLVNDNVDAGTHTIRFDGRGDNGEDLASGTYMYKITSGSYSATRKMTLSK